MGFPLAQICSFQNFGFFQASRIRRPMAVARK